MLAGLAVSADGFAEVFTSLPFKFERNFDKFARAIAPGNVKAAMGMVSNIVVLLDTVRCHAVADPVQTTKKGASVKDALQGKIDKVADAIKELGGSAVAWLESFIEQGGGVPLETPDKPVAPVVRIESVRSQSWEDNGWGVDSPRSYKEVYRYIKVMRDYSLCPSNNQNHSWDRCEKDNCVYHDPQKKRGHRRSPVCPPCAVEEGKEAASPAHDGHPWAYLPGDSSLSQVEKQYHPELYKTAQCNRKGRCRYAAATADVKLCQYIHPEDNLDDLKRARWAFRQDPTLTLTAAGYGALLDKEGDTEPPFDVLIDRYATTDQDKAFLRYVYVLKEHKRKICPISLTVYPGHTEKGCLHIHASHSTIETNFRSCQPCTPGQASRNQRFGIHNYKHSPCQPRAGGVCTFSATPWLCWSLHDNDTYQDDTVAVDAARYAASSSPGKSPNEYVMSACLKNNPVRIEWEKEQACIAEEEAKRAPVPAPASDQVVPGSAVPEPNQLSKPGLPPVGAPWKDLTPPKQAPANVPELVDPPVKTPPPFKPVQWGPKKVVQPSAPSQLFSKPASLQQAAQTATKAGVVQLRPKVEAVKIKLEDPGSSAAVGGFGQSAFASSAGTGQGSPMGVSSRMPFAMQATATKETSQRNDDAEEQRKAALAKSKKDFVPVVNAPAAVQAPQAPKLGSVELEQKLKEELEYLGIDGGDAAERLDGKREELKTLERNGNATRKEGVRCQEDINELESIIALQVQIEMMDTAKAKTPATKPPPIDLPKEEEGEDTPARVQLYVPMDGRTQYNQGPLPFELVATSSMLADVQGQGLILTSSTGHGNFSIGGKGPAGGSLKGAISCYTDNGGDRDTILR